MSTLFTRNGRWVLEYREAGKLHRKSIGISADVDPKGIFARQYQRDHDTKQAKQSVGIDDSPTPVSAAFDAHLRTLYQSSPRYLQNMTGRAERWCSWFNSRGIIHIERVTPEIVDAWILERSEAGVSPKTIKDDIALLKSVARRLNRTKTAPIPVDSWPNVARVISGPHSRPVNHMRQKSAYRPPWYNRCAAGAFQVSTGNPLLSEISHQFT